MMGFVWIFNSQRDGLTLKIQVQETKQGILVILHKL